MSPIVNYLSIRDSFNGSKVSLLFPKKRNVTEFSSIQHFPLGWVETQRFFSLWISQTQWNNHSVKCTDFPSVTTSYLLSQEKGKGVACVDCKGQGHFKMMEFERFLSPGRGNLPNVTSRNQERRNSFTAHWWEWLWCCSYLLAFLKRCISGLLCKK